jgi:hypothetical protein
VCFRMREIMALFRVIHNRRADHHARRLSSSAKPPSRPAPVIPREFRAWQRDWIR